MSIGFTKPDGALAELGTDGGELAQALSELLTDARKDAFKNKHTNNKKRNTTIYLLLYTELSMKLTCNIRMKYRETRCPESWRNSEAQSNAKKTHWGIFVWQPVMTGRVASQHVRHVWRSVASYNKSPKATLNPTECELIHSPFFFFFSTKYWKKLTFLNPGEVEIRLRSTAGVTELMQFYSRISSWDWIPPKWHLIEWMWVFLCFPSVNIVFIVWFLTCRPHRDV